MLICLIVSVYIFSCLFFSRLRFDSGGVWVTWGAMAGVPTVLGGKLHPRCKVTAWQRFIWVAFISNCVDFAAGLHASHEHQRMVLELAKEGLTAAAVDALEWLVASGYESRETLVIHTSRGAGDEEEELVAIAEPTHVQSGGGASSVEPLGSVSGDMSVMPDGVNNDVSQHFRIVRQAVEALDADVTLEPELLCRTGLDVEPLVFILDAVVPNVVADEEAVNPLVERRLVVALEGSGVGVSQNEGNSTLSDGFAGVPLLEVGVDPRAGQRPLDQRVATPIGPGELPIV